jgi:simple sugar transport system permease protein
MLPYVLTIIILILFVGRASAPKANGVPYNKGSRV